MTVEQKKALRVLNDPCFGWVLGMLAQQGVDPDAWRRALIERVRGTGARD